MPLPSCGGYRVQAGRVATTSHGLLPPCLLLLPRVLASGGGDALVSIWDLTSMACVRTLTRMDGPVRDLSVTRDGQYVAYASEPLPVDSGASQVRLRNHTQWTRAPLSEELQDLLG